MGRDGEERATEDSEFVFAILSNSPARERAAAEMGNQFWESVHRESAHARESLFPHGSFKYIASTAHALPSTNVLIPTITRRQLILVSPGSIYTAE